MENRIIKKDSLFIISWGVYSNYDFIGIFRAKQDLDIDKLIDEYNSTENGKLELFGRYHKYAFAKWLSVDRNDLVQEENYAEFHLDEDYYDYLKKDESFVTNRNWKDENMENLFYEIEEAKEDL